MHFSLSINTNRLIIPPTIPSSILNRFIEIELTKGSSQSSFVIFLAKTRRFFVPIEIRKALHLQHNDQIKVNLQPLQNTLRTPILIKDKKFDFLSSVPITTLSGYSVLVLPKRNNLLCWYSSQGRPNELLIKRFADPLKIARFIGYYQAESGKSKLFPRRGRELNFTNTKLTLIQDFLSLSQKFLDITLWHVTISYNKNVQPKFINDLIHTFVDYGLLQKNIHTRIATRIKNYTIKTYISNSVLAETIALTSNKLQNYLATQQNFPLFIEFMKAYIAGDGTFFSKRDKYGSLHSRLILHEQYYGSILLLEKIMKNHGFSGRIRKHATKNLYLFITIINWDFLFLLLQYDLLALTPNHKEKLINALLTHKNYHSLKYILDLPSRFSYTELKLNCSRKGWLNKRIREGLIAQTQDQTYILTLKGIRTKELLNKLPC